MAAAEKQAVTGAGPFNGLLTWIDQRFPLMQTWRSHLSEYYAPKNFNFWYYFGSLALFVLVIQVVTGIFLTMNYKPDAAQAFASVEYIMREVPWGWWIRYMHSTGASFFFICVYLHMFRAMLYGSYRKPRELLWIFGMLIFLCLMAEAFFGYLLPWGQMSYWGAQVIVNREGRLRRAGVPRRLLDRRVLRPGGGRLFPRGQQLHPGRSAEDPAAHRPGVVLHAVLLDPARDHRELHVGARRRRRRHGGARHLERKEHG